ncbi:alpha-N-acetylgalactosaminide alpha-2,6-sialyltransferase 1-like [Micropterus dolomieu]|uniref:alpha-N-acetylgalactosaminide alpha-2,6-sialyltransferase 1-like n=1 Tax=Micropterus dolomieu TaxID=147949 RepID=UPI001E8D4379|nr:alpha-N-acetylgalactosaminide alpha-2,6-sialyltransferase 1-like [Micropterus dolomieu]
MTSLKLIPKPKEPPLLPKPGSGGCVRCAVVATGGILNGSKTGKEIDSHNYVFRMNGAVIKGYEEDVVSRTSVYVDTAHSITMSPYFFNKYGYTSAPHDEILSPNLFLICVLWTYSGGQYNESRFYVLHQDFLRYVRNRYDLYCSQGWTGTKNGPGIFGPDNPPKSSCLYTCTSQPAQQLCPKGNSPSSRCHMETRPIWLRALCCHTWQYIETVNAYGFMTEDYKKYSNYYAEKNIKTNVIFYTNHDYILEMNTWKKLHDSKIMRLYQRTDSETGTEKPK